MATVRTLTTLGLFFFLGGCMFGSKQTFTTEDIAQFTLPKGWSLRDVERQGQWVAHRIVKSETFWFGAGDPREVEGWVILALPNAAPASIEDGMKFAFGQVQINTRRFDEFGNLKSGSRTTWISEGNYQIHSIHDPHKVTFLRSIDPERRAALVLRVYTKKIKHEKLREIEHEFFTSLKFLK